MILAAHGMMPGAAWLGGRIRVSTLAHGNEKFGLSASWPLFPSVHHPFL